MATRSDNKVTASIAELLNEASFLDALRAVFFR